SLHLNGCPNSCARIQTADIGLKGQIITNDEGQQVPGFQVHVGGGLASKDRDEAGLGRTVRGLKIAVDDLSDYVEKLVRRFLAGRSETETFSECAHRVDEEELKLSPPLPSAPSRNSTLSPRRVRVHSRVTMKTAI